MHTFIRTHTHARCIRIRILSRTQPHTRARIRTFTHVSVHKQTRSYKNVSDTISTSDNSLRNSDSEVVREEPLNHDI